MSLLIQIKTYKIRFAKSFLLYLIFFTIGLSVAVIGPTLLDFQLLVNAELSEIAWILPARAGGYAAGSIIGGLLINFLETQIAITCCLFISTLALGSVTWHRTLIGLSAALCLNGVVLGMIETFGTIWILHLWGKENAPFMQTLHFAFGLGCFVAPIISEPFLLPLNDSVEEINGTSIEKNIFHYTPDDVQLKYPYGMISLFSLLMVVAFIIMYLKYPKTEPHPSRVTTKDDDGKGKARSQEIVKIIVICLTTLFMHTYCGLEIGFGVLLTTYAVKGNLHLSKSIGSYMSSVYWGSFTCFRLVAVFVVDIVGPKWHLTFNLTLIAISNLIMLPFADSHVWALWTGVVLMGLGCSSIWACIFGYLEQYFPVTGRISSGFTAAATIGEFILPLIVSRYIESYSKIFLVIIAFNTFACCIIFAIVHVLCEKYLKK